MTLHKGISGFLVGCQKEQTVPRAEHHALRECLDQIQLEPYLNQQGKEVHIYTDCKLVFDGFHQGPYFEHKGAFADFWRFWWADWQRLSCRVLVHKVKAHQSIEALEIGSTQRFLAMGNDLADHWAKEGAKQHSIPHQVRKSWLHFREQNLAIMRFIVAALVEGMKREMLGAQR